MAKIIDLRVLQPDPLTIEIPNGDVFTIPGTISLGFLIKLEKYQEDLQNGKAVDKLRLMQNMLIEVFRLDKENQEKVDVKYIEDNNLDSTIFMEAIMEGVSNHIMNISKDENLKSPKSNKK